MSQPEFSVVIACYNSGSWIDELVERVGAAMEPLGTFELILVNDASPDKVTWDAIARNARSRAWVKGIDLFFNTGQFRAILAGLEAATGSWVITMDDDLQHPPEELPTLVTAAREHPEMDAVIGSFGKKQHAFFRNLGSKLVGTIFRKVYRKPSDLQTTNFRIMRRGLVEAVLAHQTVKPILGALVLQSSNRLMNVPVAHHPRAHGRSGYSLGRMINATLDNIVNSSAAPLRMVSTLGIGVSLIAFLLAVMYFIDWAMGGIGRPGFITLVLLILFFGGAILFAVGLVGEYVVRVVGEVTGPPRYRIREVVGGSDASAVDPALPPEAEGQ